jgi:hypothetical protein
MKVFWHIAWILGALLLIVSLDTVPDPPAVNPHTASIELDGLVPLRLELDAAVASAHLNVFFLEFWHDQGSNHSSDSILLTGRATDTSPPSAV